MINWAQAAPAVMASFLGSFVEVVEAFTLILAAASVRGWRPALLGTAAGLGVLIVLVVALGPLFTAIPIHLLQIFVGILLLLFGMRWLRKAVLRSAGVIGLHDEEAIYAKQISALRADGIPPTARLDKVAVAATFKAVSLEGLEVVFIVIATGAAGHTLVPAILGAAAAGILVILMGVALRHPLTRVPENTLKYAVGILLSAFGVFWVGEGLRLGWPGEDLSLLGLAAGFLAVSVLLVQMARRLAGRAARAEPFATKG